MATSFHQDKTTTVKVLPKNTTKDVGVIIFADDTVIMVKLTKGKLFGKHKPNVITKAKFKLFLADDKYDNAEQVVRCLVDKKHPFTKEALKYAQQKINKVSDSSLSLDSIEDHKKPFVTGTPPPYQQDDYARVLHIRPVTDEDLSHMIRGTQKIGELALQQIYPNLATNPTSQQHDLQVLMWKKAISEEVSSFNIYQEILQYLERYISDIYSQELVKLQIAFKSQVNSYDAIPIPDADKVKALIRHLVWSPDQQYTNIKKMLVSIQYPEGNDFLNSFREIIGEFDSELYSYNFFRSFYEKIQKAIPKTPKKASASPPSDGAASEVEMTNQLPNLANMSPRVQISPLNTKLPSLPITTRPTPLFTTSDDEEDCHESIYSHQLSPSLAENPVAIKVKEALHNKTYSRQVDELIRTGVILEDRNNKLSNKAKILETQNFKLAASADELQKKNHLLDDQHYKLGEVLNKHVDQNERLKIDNTFLMDKLDECDQERTQLRSKSHNENEACCATCDNQQVIQETVDDVFRQMEKTPPTPRGIVTKHKEDIVQMSLPRVVPDIHLPTGRYSENYRNKTVAERQHDHEQLMQESRMIRARNKELSEKHAAMVKDQLVRQQNEKSLATIIQQKGNQLVAPSLPKGVESKKEAMVEELPNVYEKHPNDTPGTLLPSDLEDSPPLGKTILNNSSGYKMNTLPAIRGTTFIQQHDSGATYQPSSRDLSDSDSTTSSFTSSSSTSSDDEIIEITPPSRTTDITKLPPYSKRLLNLKYANLFRDYDTYRERVKAVTKYGSKWVQAYFFWNNPGTESVMKKFKSITHPNFTWNPPARFPRLTPEQYSTLKTQMLQGETIWTIVRQLIMNDTEHHEYQIAEAARKAAKPQEQLKINITPLQPQEYLRTNITPLEAIDSTRSVYFQDDLPVSQMHTPIHSKRHSRTRSSTPIVTTTDPNITKILETLVQKTKQPMPYQNRPTLRDFKFFRGTMSENINSFLNKFESIAKIQNLNEINKIQALAYCLQEGAEGVLDEEISNNAAYEQLKTKLITLYDTKQKQDAITRQFDSMRLKPTDNVMTFLQQFNMLIKENRNVLDDRAKLEKLKTSVRSHQKLYDHVFLVKDPETFQAACNYMITYIGHHEAEDVFAEVGKYTLASSSPKVNAEINAKSTIGKTTAKKFANPDYDPTKKYFCENHGGDIAHHNTADCKGKGKLNPVKEQLKSLTTAIQSMVAQPPPTPSPAPTDSLFANIITTLGNLKANTEVPKTYNAVKGEYPPKIPCDVCKKDTHKKEDCRLNPASPNYGLTFDQLQEKSTCRICKKTGHFTSKCPDKNANSTTTQS